MHKLILLITVLPSLALAAGPQGSPQIYRLSSGNTHQVVMLTDLHHPPTGKEFSAFEDSGNITQDYFHEGQTVFVWCNGKTYRNKIQEIGITDIGEKQDSMRITTINMEKPLSCKGASLISSNPLPEQKWTKNTPTKQDVKVIQKKFGLEENSEVSTIDSQKYGKFYLVHDMNIKSLYNSGGHRLLDKNYAEISMLNEGGDVSPLIDLDNDSFPEFFLGSTDGLSASIVTMFPKLIGSQEIHKTSTSP